MPFFTDFAEGARNYLEDCVGLDFVDIKSDGPVNVGEVVKFQVRVNNRGSLNMTDVILTISGRNGAKVSANYGGQYKAAIRTEPMAVLAHQVIDTVDLYCKAPGIVQPAGTELVVAKIENWIGNLDYILNDCCGPDYLHSAKLVGQVHPL